MSPSHRSSELQAGLAGRLNPICDRFEKQWLAGQAPRLEDFLPLVDAADQPALLRELLILDVPYRGRRGERPGAAEYRQRLPQWADLIDAFFETASAGLAEQGLVPEPASLVLRVVAGPRTGESIRVTGHARVLVGRGPLAKLALDRDGKVSRFHCWIEFNAPRARHVDISKHGTRLNGQAIKEADLRHGDRIELSKSVLQVRLPGTPDPEPITTTDALPTDFPVSSPPDLVPFLPAAQVVPGYLLKRKLEAGGMGVVYRARREQDGAVVALKMILPALRNRPDLSAKFLREMRILAQLQHPHIVRWLDSGDTGNLLFFAMEFVDGPSASQVVKQSGPLAPERVVALGCQLLDALAFAHARGFVHRDVKPGNLLLENRNGAEQLKLADFGLAKAYQESSLSGLTLTGTAGGTAAFMPPEQVVDFRSARPAADRYGAAATLYYLLTGQHIYEQASSTLDLLQRILNDEPIPLRDAGTPAAVPDRLRTVLRRALARDPARRYPDAHAMRLELSRAL